MTIVFGVRGHRVASAPPKWRCRAVSICSVGNRPRRCLTQNQINRSCLRRLTAPRPPPAPKHTSDAPKSTGAPHHCARLKRRVASQRCRLPPRRRSEIKHRASASHPSRLGGPRVLDRRPSLHHPHSGEGKANPTSSSASISITATISPSRSTACRSHAHARPRPGLMPLELPDPRGWSSRCGCASPYFAEEATVASAAHCVSTTQHG